MQYFSTRGSEFKISAAAALIKGLAPDGGLFVPVHIPQEHRLEKLPALDYPKLAQIILEPFLSGFSQDEIFNAVNRAYNLSTFEHRLITPLVTLEENLHVLELWHGPTAAFKDIALQLLPHLLKTALENSGFNQEMVILTATSGDTGKAALEGFRDIPGFKIVVFYPENGVSAIQKLQMVTQSGSNVAVCAIRGNFDDTQRAVKELFSNSDLALYLNRRGYRLSSANSINWGRLLPQIVFYFQAYLTLLQENKIRAGEKINYVVPTGNFGNILAGYYAKRLGLPVNRLICASNQNNVLYDFINTAVYNSNRPLSLTLSPSMDILVSSNLERLLFELNGHDAEKISSWMQELKEKGYYKTDKETHEKIKALFFAGYATDQKTLATIKQVYQGYHYLIDTHTAVGKAVLDDYLSQTGDLRPAVILSTASPFKFAESVLKALSGEERAQEKPAPAMLKELSRLTAVKVPAGLAGLENKEIKFKEVAAAFELRHHLLKILSLT